MGERQQIAGHTGAATVPDHAALGALGCLAVAGTASAPVELAALDDDGDVLVAIVVLHELRVKLIGKWLWDYAIDHQGTDLTLSVPRSKGRSDYCVRDNVPEECA